MVRARIIHEDIEQRRATTTAVEPVIAVLLVLKSEAGGERSAAGLEARRWRGERARGAKSMSALKMWS